MIEMKNNICIEIKGDKLKQKQTFQKLKIKQSNRVLIPNTDVFA